MTLDLSDLDGLPPVELVRQSAAVYSEWGRCYQVVVIPPRAGAR
jgi:hypothetical protein